METSRDKSRLLEAKSRGSCEASGVALQREELWFLERERERERERAVALGEREREREREQSCGS